MVRWWQRLSDLQTELTKDHMWSAWQLEPETMHGPYGKTIEMVNTRHCATCNLTETCRTDIKHISEQQPHCT